MPTKRKAARVKFLTLDQRPGDTPTDAGQTLASSLLKWRRLATRLSGSVLSARHTVRRAEARSARREGSRSECAITRVMTSAMVRTASEVMSPGDESLEVAVIRWTPLPVGGI